MSVIRPWSLHPELDPADPTDILMRRTPSRTKKEQEISIDSISPLIAEYGMHTGVIKNMIITENSGDNTRFDMSAGTAIKVDKSDPDNPIVTKVKFPGLTGQLVTNLSVSFHSVFIDEITQIVTTEDDEPNSLSDINDRIFCGTIITTAGVISAVIDNPIIAYGSSISEITEMVLGGGVTVRDGLVTPSGSNLKLNIDDTTIQMYGRGRQFDPKNPNTSEIASQTPVPVGNFVKIFEDPLGELDIDFITNDINPTQFNEDGLGILETVANNQYTTFRGFYGVFPGGASRFIIYYGTQQFITASLALTSIEMTFKENEVTVRLAPLTDIAVRQDVVDLTAAVISGLAIIKPKLRRV